MKRQGFALRRKKDREKIAREGGIAKNKNGDKSGQFNKQTGSEAGKKGAKIRWDKYAKTLKARDSGTPETPA